MVKKKQIRNTIIILGILNEKKNIKIKEGSRQEKAEKKYHIMWLDITEMI